MYYVSCHEAFLRKLMKLEFLYSGGSNEPILTLFYNFQYRSAAKHVVYI
jgi:hypothetical protein